MIRASLNTSFWNFIVNRHNSALLTSVLVAGQSTYSPTSWSARGSGKNWQSTETRKDSTAADSAATTPTATRGWFLVFVFVWQTALVFRAAWLKRSGPMESCWRCSCARFLPTPLHCRHRTSTTNPVYWTACAQTVRYRGPPSLFSIYNDMASITRENTHSAQGFGLSARHAWVRPLVVFCPFPPQTDRTEMHRQQQARLEHPTPWIDRFLKLRQAFYFSDPNNTGTVPLRHHPVVKSPSQSHFNDVK